MTYQVIAYGGANGPTKVRGGLTFERAERLRERCYAAGDKDGISYEIHEEEAR
jgi:hypothetical protein